MRPIRPAAGIAVLMATAALGEPHKVAIHGDEDNVKTMTMARDTAANIHRNHGALGADGIVEIVTYGPGLHTLREDTSPVADRTAVMALEYPEAMRLSACLNSVQTIEQRLQREVTLVSEAVMVPSGAVRLMELQQQNCANLRP